MRVYVAGPMSGIADHNIPAFRAAAAKCRALGFEVIDPTDQGYGVDHPASWYVRQELPLLASCDAIALLPGWATSRGARIEVRAAIAMGLRVLRADNGDDIGPVVLNAVGVIDNGLPQQVNATPGLAHALDMPNALIPRRRLIAHCSEDTR